MFGFSPSSAFGSSSAIPNTFLSAKKSETGELETVQEAEQVEEERVAAKAGEELHAGTAAAVADDRVRAEADRRARHERLLMPVEVSVFDLSVQLRPRDFRELLAAALRREAVPERDVRHCVRIRVDERLVDRIGTELVGVRRCQRVHVRYQDCAPRIARLLDRVE